ncbi:MAG: glycosyltransferase, partial [Muribaculaceae bacterium]|nr:glycosyltransferase [Muribaculaceae bacterium]
EVAATLPLHLKVAGDGPLEQPLREKYANASNIEFVGLLDQAQVRELMAHAQFTVMPSEWPENCPLSVIESLCLGTPAVGTHNGGIPELIDYTNGIVARPQALGTAIEQAHMRSWDYEEISHDAIEQFNPETHYNGLMKIYQP